jgi:hypothetical protein
MAPHQRYERPKLPHVRTYLRTAQWGFDQMNAAAIAGTFEGGADIRFFLIGILASLRAVQHSLKEGDATISPDHKRDINEWWSKTKLDAVPELKFIQTSRNLILKEGRFAAYLTMSEPGIGTKPERPCEPDEKAYDLAYYDDEGERHDLDGVIGRRLVDS